LLWCSPPAAPVANFTADQPGLPLQSFLDDLSTNFPIIMVFHSQVSQYKYQSNPSSLKHTGDLQCNLTVSNTQDRFRDENELYHSGQRTLCDFDYETDNFTVTFENLSQFGTTYLWNFGDGQTSTQFNPVHVFEEDGTYAVKLTTTSPCGSDMVTYFITILTPPFADFASDVVEGCDPFEVEFYNFSSSNATDFVWNFPGGSPPTSTAFEPNVLYETPGTYNVTLTAINAAGDDVYTATNYITVNPIPGAVFTYSGSGLQITFNSAGSVGNFYMWNFGDGQTSTQQNPCIHAVGKFNVTLTEATIGLLMTNYKCDGAPVAEFIADVEDGCPVLVVHFISTSRKSYKLQLDIPGR
jgi:PKD repeat protein